MPSRDVLKALGIDPDAMDKTEGLGKAFGDLGETLEKYRKLFTVFGETEKKRYKEADDYKAKAQKAAESQQQTVGAIQAGAGIAQAGLSGGVGGALSAAAPMIGEAVGGPVGGAVANALQPVIKALADPIGTLKGVIDSIKGQFDQVVNVVRPFVEAFAPTTVQVFDQAMRDVTAVIGSAFVPVMQGAMVVVRGFGDAMLPVMRQLEPVIKKVTDNVLRLLMPVINQWSGQLTVAAEMLGLLVEAMQVGIPAYEALVDVARSVNAVYVGVANVLVSVGKTFLPMLGLMVSSGTSFRDSVQQMALAALKAAAALARLAGVDSFIAGMRKAFGGDTAQGSTVGFAAAQGARTTEVPSWVHELASAASMASGQMGQSEEDKWRSAVLQMLDDTAKQEALGELIKKEFAAVVGYLEGLPAKLAALLKEETVKQSTHIRRKVDKASGIDKVREFFGMEE